MSWRMSHPQGIYDNGKELLELGFGESLENANPGQEKSFAENSFLEELKNSIFNNLLEREDYKISINEGFSPQVPNSFSYLCTTYLAFIGNGLFDEITCRLSQEKRIINEGSLEILTRDQLLEGNKKSAWGSLALVSMLIEECIQDYDFILPNTPRSCLGDKASKDIK